MSTTKLRWLQQIRRVLLDAKAPTDTWRYTLDEVGLRAARKARPNARLSDTGPQDAFTAELARASNKAQRFLGGRGLTRDDREDIISAALLWCWEHRESYSLTTTLDTWFVNAVKDAYKAWRRAENSATAHPEELEVVVEDDVSLHVSTLDAITQLLIALTEKERDVAQMQMMGLSRQEMMKRGFSKNTIDDARAKFRQLRKEHGNL